MDFSREKFTHRAQEWQRISSYQQRKILHSGKLVDVVQYEVPAELSVNKGRKILWFSDLHIWGDQEMDENVAAESSALINQIQADFLIYGGDLVMYSSALPMARNFLKSLPENAVRIAIMGNWEYAKKWLKLKDWQDFFAAAGFKLLINEAFESGDFYFYGTDDLRKGKPSGPAEIPDNKDVVFLAHSPDSFIHISRRKILTKCNLVLCGHTHGGQVRLPFLGALLTSSRYWRKFDYGHFVNSHSGSHMLVSSGLGCSTLTLRVSCRRELVLVNLI